MDNPIDSILNTYPSDFFRSLEERTNAAFMKAHHLTCEYYAEPEQVSMLGQARHACCEEGFRAAAQDSGLAARVLHTRPPGGRYSLVSYEGVHLIRCNVQAHCGTPRPNPVPECVGGAERLAGSHPARSAAGRAKAAIGAALRDDRRDRAQTIR